MSEDQQRACSIGLATCPDVEPSTLRKLFRGCGGAVNVWEADARVWRTHCNMRTETVARLDRWRRTHDGETIELRLRERGIRCLTPIDEAWPARLSDLVDPPYWLFVKGDSSRAANAVAVVGTRRASGYGLEAARWIAETLVSAGCDIVSGLALGIDACAHQAALAGGGRTIAVLASGVDVCYPSSHQRLYQQICDRGYVLSEYAPGSAVAKHRFPERNRLIAALADVVVVVQAGERSGALRTAEEGLELGRDIYVVPGPITSVHFRGSHRLLQDGAQILLDPHDLLTDLRLEPHSAAPEQVPDRWRSLLDCLDEPVSAPDLSRRLAKDAGEIYAGLLELELAGWVQRVAGGLYQRQHHA